MKIILNLLLLLCFTSSLLAQKENAFERAEDAFMMSRYKEAKALYTKLLIDGDEEWNYFIYYRRAYCHYGLDQYEEAIKDAKKALRINSRNEDYIEVKGQSFWLLSSIFAEREEHEKSIEYLNYVVKISEETYVWNNIGYSQLKLEQYAAALESFNKSLELNLDNAYAYSNRSLANLKLGQIDKAKEDIKKAFELDPNDPYTYKYQAQIYLALKEVDQACKALAKAKDLGYEKFGYGKAADAQEVNDLIEKHCVDTK